MDVAGLRTLLAEKAGIELKGIVQEEKHETINKNVIFNSDRGKLFVKYNTCDVANSMFESERVGLNLIRSTGIIRVPETHAVVENPGGTGAVIVLEYLENMEQLGSMMADFGMRVARLHKHNLDLLKSCEKTGCKLPEDQSPQPVRMFGFPRDVFYGPHFHIPANTWYDCWLDLFARHIMAPQFVLAEQKVGGRELSELWAHLQLLIDRFFRGQAIKPSLCVGDLASDNCGQLASEPVLFDPYCVYAHHEFDLTQPFLVDDFSPVFHTAYQSVLPKGPGFESRKALYSVFGCMIRYNYGMEEYRDKAIAALKSAIAIAKNL